MDDQANLDKERWESIHENFDLLFAKVEEVDRMQHKLEAKVDISASVLDQMIKDQQTLAKQIETTGQAVAQLTIKQMRTEEEIQGSTASSETSTIPPFRPRRQGTSRGGQQGRNPFAHNRDHQPDRSLPKGFAPKMNFPRFNGKNPRIWKDKCQDYFQLMNIPESMWATAASLHMDDNAEKWLQVYKLKHGLGTWTELMTAVEQKFGAYDYQHAIDDLLELHQTGTVEEYVSEFEALQYQVAMHDLGMGDTYFVSQFIKGLKPEIRYSVQGQVPGTMEKAVMLAKIQQSIQDKTKHTGSRFHQPFKQTSTTSAKYDQPKSASPLQLTKERQLRDYCRTNNLCFYCREPYDATH